jgi:2-polyprenyl-6-methoxyphenol hydroxylase-like FAD-dependent oxidoreductase
MMLWPNATRSLRELGVLEAVLARGGPSTNFLVRSAAGRVLMDLALGNFDTPAVCMRRSDLLAVLLAALPQDRIRLGYELEQIEQATGKVRLKFTNGLCEEFDAAIGADGIRSRVRAQLFGASAPVYRRYTVWRGISRYSGAAVRPGYNSETWGAGHRFGILATGGDLYTWYATANVPEDHSEAPCGRKQEVLQMFQHWHEPVPQLIEAADDNAILKNPAYDRLALESWGYGAVTLLGDAAHPCTPNLGQAGCMALEDAVVLAKCVRQEATLEGAFRRYESLRGARTKHIQQRSRLMGSLGQWENRPLVAGREVITSLLPAALFEHNLRRVYSYET